MTALRPFYRPFVIDSPGFPRAPFEFEGDEVPWYWPGVVHSDQTRGPGPDIDVSVPVAMGAAFALTPYLVGFGLLIFAPPWMKPLGFSMIVPGPSDPVLFAIGYEFGQEVEHYF